MQANAGDEDCRDHNQSHSMATRQRHPHDGAFVLAEQTLDAFQRDRIDVPSITGIVNHLIDQTIMRRMEAVIHARREAQRDVAAIAVGCDEFWIAKQVCSV